MNKDWFEKALRDKYPAEAHDFDADATWAALEARRGKKRRRPFIFWWWSAAGVIALGAAGLLWYGSGSGQELPHRETQPAHVSAPQQPIAETNTPTLPAISPKNGSNVPNKTAPTSARTLPSEIVSAASKTADTRKPTDDHAYAATPETSRDIATTETQPGSTTPVSAPPDAVTSAGTSSKFAVESLPLLAHAIPPVLFEPANPDFPAYFGEAKKRRKSKEAQWWIGATAHYGWNMVNRKGLADYQDKRAAEETALDMFQTGLDIRRQLNSRVFLQSGIYFSQWTDVVERNFKETYIELDSNYVVARIVRADGTIEDVYGEAEILHIRTVARETYNRYRHIELPLLVGISLPVGAQWRLEGSAGPMLGLLSTRTGAILDHQTGGDISLKDAPYRNNFTLSGLARVEWMYTTRRWAAGISLMGRTSLTDWTSKNPVFTEKRAAVGAGLVFRKALR